MEESMTPDEQEQILNAVLMIDDCLDLLSEEETWWETVGPEAERDAKMRSTLQRVREKLKELTV